MKITAVNYNYLFSSSHDHQFVQTVADRIIEISDNTILDRKGTYDEFLEDFNEDQLKKY